jgi:glycine oxidase
MYPEFVHELEDESGVHVDLRDHGTIILASAEHAANLEGHPLPAPLSSLEPALADLTLPAFFLKERSVDPRALIAASVKAAKHRGVDISSGSEVTSVVISDNHVTGVATAKSTYSAATVVNCAGPWAGHFAPLQFPTRPVKGQMLCVAAPQVIKHVVRAPDVYLVPRSDGRILIGSTLEEAGFDKRVVPETIQRLQHAAIRLVPALQQARILEDWAGLRPGTPDDLPILGATSLPGYFVAAGHYRDGILLAPVTAKLMAQVIVGEIPALDLSAFSPTRFPPQKAIS